MSGRSAGALALLVLSQIACAPQAGNARPPSLSSVIDQQVAAAGAVVWSSGRPLTWGDFRGAPPTSPGDEGASTAYSLFHGARCTGRRFEFRVLAAVLPSRSWVAPAVVRNPALSARSLQHEQTHFDLSEVHARRMRRYFQDLREPCRNSETELNAFAQRFVVDEAAAQKRYDEETNYGRILARQADWDANAAREMTALRAYEVTK